METGSFQRGQATSPATPDFRYWQTRHRLRAPLHSGILPLYEHQRSQSHPRHRQQPALRLRALAPATATAPHPGILKTKLRGPVICCHFLPLPLPKLFSSSGTPLITSNSRESPFPQPAPKMTAFSHQFPKTVQQKYRKTADPVISTSSGDIVPRSTEGHKKPPPSGIRRHADQPGHPPRPTRRHRSSLHCWRFKASSTSWAEIFRISCINSGVGSCPSARVIFTDKPSSRPCMAV